MVVMVHSTVLLLYLIIAVSSVMIVPDGVTAPNPKSWLSYSAADLEFISDMWGVMLALPASLVSSFVILSPHSHMNGLVINYLMPYYSLLVMRTVLLILSNSFHWLMLGRDGLGVASSCLIVYYSNNTSINNGTSTLFQNRVGDFFPTSVACLLLNVAMESMMIRGVLVTSLILGARVKSAQPPSNSRLLAAMSAPTPISSLVHSSTLVVAGAYVIMRFGYCMTDYSDASKWISIVSLFLSGVGSSSELDTKKLTAHPTTSHTSLMLFMSSLGINKVASFHPNIHAMFKSMIFTGPGSAMLSSFHSQDSRIISYSFINPTTKILLLFPGPRPPGLPSSSGLYSKDFITEAAVSMEGGAAQRFMFLGSLGTSVYYGPKLMVLTSSNSATGHNSLSSFGPFSSVPSAALTLFTVNMHIVMVSGVSLGIPNLKHLVYFVILAHILTSWSKSSSLIVLSSTLSVLLKDVTGSSWLVNFSPLDTKFFVTTNNLVPSSSAKSLMTKKLSLANRWVVMMFVVVVYN